jgi:hypothetical protein
VAAAEPAEEPWARGRRRRDQPADAQEAAT